LSLYIQKLTAAPLVLPASEYGGVISALTPVDALNELNIASPAPECVDCVGFVPDVTLDQTAAPEVSRFVHPVGGNVVLSNDSVFTTWPADAIGSKLRAVQKNAVIPALGIRRFNVAKDELVVCLGVFIVMGVFYECRLKSNHLTKLKLNFNDCGKTLINN
jgi:hypothetical protein